MGEPVENPRLWVNQYTYVLVTQDFYVSAEASVPGGTKYFTWWSTFNKPCETVNNNKNDVNKQSLGETDIIDEIS